jgi:hypothetical protein
MVLQPSPCLSAVKGCWVCYLCSTLPAVLHLPPQSPPFLHVLVLGLGSALRVFDSRAALSEPYLQVLSQASGARAQALDGDPTGAGARLPSPPTSSPSTKDGSKTRTSLPRVGERLSTPTPWTPSVLASPCSNLARLDATLDRVLLEDTPST